MPRDARFAAAGGPKHLRRQLLGAAGAGGALLLLPRAAVGAGAARPRDSAVVQWNGALLQGVRDAKLGPPMVARALAIAHYCIYDAWAAYDHKAVGTRLGGSLRRPPAERTLAEYRAGDQLRGLPGGLDLFPASTSSVFDPLMQTLGYDPGDLSTDTSTPAGVGNVAARAVLDVRHRDGANQLGDEPGGIPASPTPTTRATDRRTTRWTSASRLTRRPFTTPACGSPCATSTPARSLVSQGFVGAQWQQRRPHSPSAPDRCAQRTARRGTDRPSTAPRRALCSTSAPA